MIVEPTFAQPTSTPATEILNRKYFNLQPEELQFNDDSMMYVASKKRTKISV
jgi:hypothetical protein